MKYEVRLETAIGRPLAIVRRRASLQQLPRVVPDACGVVSGLVRTQQIKGSGRNVALYLDEQINLEVGVELPAPIMGQLAGSALPGGTVATTTHFGPYGRLHAAHQAIRDWGADHLYAFAGPNWEIYGHWEDAWNSAPDRIRTDVFYLLTAGTTPAG